MQTNRVQKPNQSKIIPIIAVALVVLVVGLIVTATLIRSYGGEALKTLQTVKESSAVAGESEIDGQVFVVTKGAGTYKLGLVTVYFTKPSGEAVAAVKTDADGKFNVKIPRGQYIVKAFATRKTFEDVEIYDWEVSQTFDQPKQQLFLSNDNMK